MQESLRIVKKYPNRRLYDTEQGIYITLEEVKTLVYDRVNFKVIDARTHKDLTQTILLQIIAEEEANNTPLFSTAVLQDFIRFYKENSQPLFSQYLEQSMGVFFQQRDFFKHQWENYQKLITPSPIGQLLKAAQTPLRRASKKKKAK